jgi:HEAT repeat protein
VLARASDAPRARSAVFAVLHDRSLSEVARVDLLRALGSRIIRFRPAASQAFGRLATLQASFRTRYLLLGPAAALAVGDASALAYLRRALVADRSPYIRAQAARVVTDPALLPDELLRALHDPNVRVREAALGTLATRRAQFAAVGIAERLSRDPWPLVRAAAAEALAELGPGQGPDRALYEALDDESAYVRGPVLRALGRRGARAYAEAVRERLTDSDEPYEVRIAAAHALGLMCDTEAIGVLTDYALLLADPMSAGRDALLGPAALRALARLNPPDLPKRLAPLQSDKAPTLTRQAARAALGRRGGCRR